MEELTSIEFLFLKTVNDGFGLKETSGISLVECRNYLSFNNEFLFKQAVTIMNSLAEKEVICSSPDGMRLKLTDFGWQLFSNKVREEENWLNQGPFVKMNPNKKDEINIKQGEHFKGVWEVISVLKRAIKNVKIQDAYIGVETLAILNELKEEIAIQILTSDKWKDRNLFFPILEKFRKSRKGKIEIKINNSIHSRRMIIDDSEVYSSDDSFKDIGLHSSAKIKCLMKIEEEIINFNKAWSVAKDF